MPNIELLDITKLTPYLDNPRIASDPKRLRLRASIKRFGCFKPMGIVWRDGDGNDVVIAGNQRLAVLTEMAEAGELPFTVEFEHEGETVTTTVDAASIQYTRFRGPQAEAKAIAIRDNTDEGEWDYDALPDFVADLRSVFGNDDLSALTGFKDDMLADLKSLSDGFDPAAFEFAPPGEGEGGSETGGPGSQGGRGGAGGGTPSETVRFAVGSLHGRITNELSERMINTFTEYGKRLETKDIPTILAAILDDAGESK